MTPKEKAIELVKKMYGNIFDGGQYDAADDAWYRSKQCALIAVDEILKIAPMMHLEAFGNYTIREYYIKVKQEINNL